MKQNTPEWLEMRRKMIGASDAPVIMGVSPWKTPGQLWKEKLFPGYDKEPNAYMKRGLLLEDKAREFFKSKTGITVQPEVAFHKSIPWMMASLDGIDDQRKSIVEIKCPGNVDHSTALGGRIPEKYFPQIQHQLAVCDLDMAYYVSFDGADGCVLTVVRNQAYIDQLIAKEERFWECMETCTSPDAGNDRHAITIQSDQWDEAATEWLSINRTLQQLYEREYQLRAQLISLAANQDVSGGGVRVVRTTRRGCVNYDSIPQLKDVDLDSYRTKSVDVWKISKA